MEDVIKYFCKKYQFKQDGIEYLSESFIKLKENKQAHEIFCEKVRLYEENYRFEVEPVFTEIEALEAICGIHKYTLDLLYLIALTPHLKQLYLEHGLSEEIYDDSVCDVKWKAYEGKELFGFYGTFVGQWTIGFFRLERFAMGRLQYDLQPFAEDTQLDNVTFKKGDTFINVHIPSSGPLIYSDCQKSYARAADFYKDHFKNQPIVFGCTSWMMSPNNKKILPETSNVIKFMNDYTVIKAELNNTWDLWRIFKVFDLPENVYDLPQETSMQRAFVKWLAEGNLINIAFAIKLYHE